MRERMRASLEVERLLAWLLAAFAGLAVFLAQLPHKLGRVGVPIAARFGE